MPWIDYTESSIKSNTSSTRRWEVNPIFLVFRERSSPVGRWVLWTVCGYWLFSCTKKCFVGGILWDKYWKIHFPFDKCTMMSHPPSHSPFDLLHCVFRQVINDGKKHVKIFWERKKEGRKSIVLVSCVYVFPFRLSSLLRCTTTTIVEDHKNLRDNFFFMWILRWTNFLLWWLITSNWTSTFSIHCPFFSC